MRSASYLEGTRSPDRDGSLTALFRAIPLPACHLPGWFLVRVGPSKALKQAW